MERAAFQPIHRLLPRGVSYYGLLETLTHDRFVEIVERHGGRYVPYSHRGLFQLLVLGEGDLPIAPSGDPLDFGDRAVVAEGEFLRGLGETDAADDVAERSFTAAAIADLLKVPEARVMAWAKAGLLRPRAIDHGVMRFDFRQATLARTLVQLTETGVGVTQLRRSLEKLGRWLPDVDEPLQQLAIIERNGPLLVRLQSGELADVDGQMRLDFAGDEPPAPAPVRLEPQSHSASAWHDRGVTQERFGLLAEAVECYVKALQIGGPDAQTCFDLAHALAQMGETKRAAERYRQVTELDPTRADAWNNLGVTLSELDDPAAAVAAFREAVRLAPNNLQAIYNLADVLDDGGLSAEAKVWFARYRRLDPTDSPWGRHAAERSCQTAAND